MTNIRLQLVMAPPGTSRPFMGNLYICLFTGHVGHIDDTHRRARAHTHTGTHTHRHTHADQNSISVVTECTSYKITGWLIGRVGPR